MKAAMGAIMVALAVAALLAVDYIVYQQQLAQNQQIQQLQQQLELAHARNDALNKRLDEMEQQVRKIENASLGGIIDNANAALIEGWSAMVDAVERQLEQAKQSMEKNRQAPPSSTAPADDGQGPL